MKKVFHFESPREHYVCDAAVITCFDQRFVLAGREFLKCLGIQHPDTIRIAGGAKSLASPAQPGDSGFVLEQVRASIRLHGTTRVLLMAHADCGAYGGSARFNGDLAAEAAYYDQELHKAARELRNAIGGITVNSYFLDFYGIWEIPD